MLVIYNKETNEKFMVYGTKKCLFRTKLLIIIDDKWKWVNGDDYSTFKTIYNHNHDWHLTSIGKTDEKGISKYTWKCFACDTRIDKYLPYKQ